jgi:ferric-dicitrate binding protein FerR (iron transport regulator)
MMDDLLIKYLAQEATAAEKMQVEEWVSLSAGNQQYFKDFKSIWEQSSDLAAANEIDENDAWERFQKLVEEQPRKEAKKKAGGWWKIAASVIIIAGAALLTYKLYDKPPAEIRMLAVNTINEVIVDTLPDGSVATLNKHSGISYPSRFKGSARKIKLKGEAFFSVTPDKQKPFIIDVNDVQIRVIGTSFNVKNVSSGTEVIVETGIVQVMKNNNTVELKAGERIFLPKTDTLAKKEISDDKLYNYYVSRTFVCDNTPLWKLVDKLNEAYGVNIVIGRKSLRAMPLTVTFDDESLDVILNIIKQTLLVKVNRQADAIILN